MLESEHAPLPKPRGDNSAYIYGSIAGHNIVLTSLPRGQIGTNRATAAAKEMVRTFPNLKIGLMVGIGGGIPSKVRLGDVVVGTPVDRYPGVVQWDFGKAEDGGQFRRTGALDSPPTLLLNALTVLETDHAMFPSKVPQYLDEMKEKWPRLAPQYLRSEKLKDPLSDGTDKDFRVHFGLIASGDKVIKDAVERDRIDESLGGHVLCLEMEAAGLIDFPCLVIRGICDYADAQKNKDWQEHAAATAAAFAKELLQYLQPSEVDEQSSLKELLEKAADDISATKEHVASLRSTLDGQENRHILDWLTSIDYGMQQSDYFGKRHPQTGLWLLRTTKFQEWLMKPKSTLLGQGMPGAGKTIMTSIVIDHLLHFTPLDGTHIGIAYIFCNYNRHHEQKLGALLSSVLKQLSQSAASLPSVVRELYKAHSTKNTRPSIDELFKAIQTVVSMYTRVFIVLDALDECQTQDLCRSTFLSKLFSLQEEAEINIFATSRYNADVTAQFRGSISIEIRADPRDISEYLEGHINQLPAFIRQDIKLQENIVGVVSTAVDGMFLLAPLYLNLLEDKMTQNEVRGAIKQLHEQTHSLNTKEDNQEVLAHAYQHVMGRISHNQPGRKALAIQVLMWLTCAKRQLTTSELQEAIAIKQGSSELHPGDYPHPADMVSVCAGLVTVDEKSGIIRLVHYTTREYLKTTRNKWFPEAETKIVHACIAYLSFWSQHSDYRVYSRFSFFDYAANRWGHHARVEDKSTLLIVDFLVSLSMDSTTALLSYLWSYPGYATDKRDGRHLAAYFGLVAVTEELIRHHGGLGPALGGQSPLWIAASRGHTSVVELLLRAGAAVNDVCEEGTALMVASQSGFEGTVHALLSAGADVNAVDSGYNRQTALMVAAQYGHVHIVNALLAADADPRIRDKHGRTALMMAMALEVVDNLLAKGADPNTVDKDGQTALIMAISPEPRGVIDNLMAKGADPDVRNTHGQNPFMTFLWWPQHGVIDCLLAWGADPNIADIYGETALMMAVKYEHQELVDNLLAKGADPNTVDKNGKTALLMAAKRGRLEVVDNLLARGADPNTVDKNGKTALMMAVKYGHQELVDNLLAKGADPNTVDKNGKTALIMAAKRGHLEVIDNLLVKGADPNIADKYGYTALITATEDGRPEVVNNLLAGGADPNLADIYGETALMMAAGSGHLETVNSLLTAGAGLNAVNDNGDTALIVAVRWERHGAIDFLLASGADLDVFTQDGRSALMVGAERCNVWAIERLIKAGADVNAANQSGETALSLVMGKPWSQPVVRCLGEEIARRARSETS